MKNGLLIIFVGIITLVNAQNYVHQAIIVNEGYYDYTNAVIVEPVTIGSYDPATQSYQMVNTLTGMRFASDAIVQGDAYYVAADQNIYKFDLNTHQQLAIANCPGVRNLAYANGKIVATRGEYLTTFNSYLHIYDAADLSFITAIDNISGPKWATQNLVVDGNYVYVAVNNGYEWGNEKGIIGRLDMTSLTYGNEIDLGPDGKNPDNMVINNGFIYTINNKDWSGSSVSKVSLDGNTNTTVNIATASTGCGTSALRDDKIVYQISLENTLNEFDAVAMNNVGPVSGFNLNYYELAQNPVSGELYTSVTNFSSFGTVYIYDNSNNQVSNFSVGISPGTIVFDVRSMAGITEDLSDLAIYPNPTSESLTVKASFAKYIEITDLTGSVVLAKFITDGEIELGLENLSSGHYLCRIQSENGEIITRKITKK